MAHQGLPLRSGINEKASLIFCMATLCHNYTQPHSGIGGRMSAGTACIDIPGSDRRLTLIKTAVSGV